MQAIGNMTVSNMEGKAHSRGHVLEPAGINGNNMPAGAWMFNYQYGGMFMKGNRIGTRNVSPEFIVTNVPNPNGGPPTLRVVPTKMDMNMHMFMVMYAPTNWLTFMALSSFVKKTMQHITFQGPAGTVRLGRFKTQSKGLGDTKLSGIFKLYDDNVHRVQINGGISIPTGSITESDRVLTPMGTTPTLRLPYPMQLGSGTVDFLPGITVRGRQGKISYGARYTGVVRLGTNRQGYTLGDIHKGTAWAAYNWLSWLNTSLRVEGTATALMRGSDALIAAPVQTAVTSFYGGEKISVLFGLAARAPDGPFKGLQLAGEVGFPVYQKLNGPQLETDLVARVSLTKMLRP